MERVAGSRQSAPVVPNLGAGAFGQELPSGWLPKRWGRHVPRWSSDSGFRGRYRRPAWPARRTPRASDHDRGRAVGGVGALAGPAGGRSVRPADGRFRLSGLRQSSVPVPGRPGCSRRPRSEMHVRLPRPLKSEVARPARRSRLHCVDRCTVRTGAGLRVGPRGSVVAGGAADRGSLRAVGPVRAGGRDSGQAPPSRRSRRPSGCRARCDAPRFRAGTAEPARLFPGPAGVRRRCGLVRGVQHARALAGISGPRLARARAVATPRSVVIPPPRPHQAVLHNDARFSAAREWFEAERAPRRGAGSACLRMDAEAVPNSVITVMAGIRRSLRLERVACENLGVAGPCRRVRRRVQASDIVHPQRLSATVPAA